jgi:ribosomal protein L29
MPWIQDLFSFGPGDYHTGRFSKTKGAAHFFYGNRFFLNAGLYLATVHIAKPRTPISANIIVEALRWVDDPPEILATLEFGASNAVISLLAPLVVEVKEPGPIEIRGWSDAEGNSIHFAGLTVQSLRWEPLADRETEFFSGSVSPSADKQGSVVANHLVYAGPKRPEAFYLSRSTAEAVDEPFCEVIVPGAELPLARPDRFFFASAIPAPFMEHAVELWASVDGQAMRLWRAGGDAPLGVEVSEDTGIPEKASAVTMQDSGTASVERVITAELRDRVNVTVQTLFDERWRSLQAQMPSPGPVIGPDAMAELSDHVNEIVQRLFDERWRSLQAQVESALSDITGFRSQIPRLLNAVSAANAAASVVGKGIRNLPNTNLAAVDTASEIRDLKRELQMLRTALHSVLTN